MLVLAVPFCSFFVEFWGSGCCVPKANAVREGRKIPFETLSSWERLYFSQGKGRPLVGTEGLQGQPGELPSAHPGPLLESLWSCFSCMLKCVYRVCITAHQQTSFCARGPAESHLRAALLIAGAHAFCMCAVWAWCL